MHMLKILGSNCPMDFPESLHHALASISEGECSVSSDKMLVALLDSLSNTEKSAFMPFMAKVDVPEDDFISPKSMSQYYKWLKAFLPTPSVTPLAILMSLPVCLSVSTNPEPVACLMILNDKYA